MKVKSIILLAVVSAGLRGQAVAPITATTPAATIPVPAKPTTVAAPATVNFPANPLPVAIAAFGTFNQLGNPRFTGGISAIYPVVGSVGVYGTTTTDILPKLAIDPATGKSFYAISTTVRQGLHKDILDTGKLSFLVGGDVGPGFSQAGTSGINVSLSSSFAITALYQISPTFSAIVPIRMLYVSGIGWNPVVEMGIVVNLKNLPKSTAK